MQWSSILESAGRDPENENDRPMFRFLQNCEAKKHVLMMSSLNGPHSLLTSIIFGAVVSNRCKSLIQQKCFFQSSALMWNLKSFYSIDMRRSRFAKFAFKRVSKRLIEHTTNDFHKILIK